MKYFLYSFITFLNLSCYQCRDSYHITKISDSDSIVQHLSGDTDVIDGDKDFIIEYSNKKNVCNIIIENVDFEFYNDTVLVLLKKKVSPFKDGLTHYTEIRQLPLKDRTLTNFTPQNQKFFLIQTDFPKEYRDLSNFQLKIKTDLKDTCGHAYSSISKYDIFIENRCSFHFMMH